MKRVLKILIWIVGIIGGLFLILSATYVYFSFALDFTHCSLRSAEIPYTASEEVTLPAWQVRMFQKEYEIKEVSAIIISKDLPAKDFLQTSQYIVKTKRGELYSCGVRK